jgi:predicted amidohydrolase YtcJ
MPLSVSCRVAGVCAVLLTAVSARAAAASDTLLVHGHIYTGNAQAPWAEALAISGPRIDAVGTDAEIRKLRGAKTRTLDLHGQTVIP